MSREEALSNLQEMKETIEELFYETERANGLADQLESMNEEYKNPKPFVFKGKDDNTAEALKKSLLAKNSEKISKSRLFEKLWILLWILIYLGFTACIFLPVFGVDTYITDKAVSLTKDNNMSLVILAICHIAIGLFLMIPTISNYWSRKNYSESFITQYVDFFSEDGGVIIVLVVAVIAEYYFLDFLGQIKLLVFYPILAIGMRFPLFIYSIVRKFRVKKPNLTVSQRSQVNAAKDVDEVTKLENKRAEKEALAQYEIKVEARRKQILEDYDPTLEEAKEAKERANELLEKLDSMDILAEEEKTVPIIEILMNLIRTHRADDIKEALHEYDKIKVNEQLLAIENEKLAVMRKKAEQERADRKKHYEQQLYEARRANDLAWSANQEAKRANERMVEQQYWHNQAMEKAAKADANQLRHISNTLYDIKYYNNLDSLLNR